MAEYLSKKTLQEKLNRKKAGPANKRYTEGWNDAILMVKSMIHSEKAADVAPVVHSRWIHDERMLAVCLECGMTTVEDGTDYCPNCGAIMNLEEEQHELRRDL